MCINARIFDQGFEKTRQAIETAAVSDFLINRAKVASATEGDDVWKDNSLGRCRIPGLIP